MAKEDFYSETQEPAPIQSWVNSDTMAQIINRRAIVQEILDTLSGTIRDANGQEIKKLDTEPLINERGIHSVARILNSQLTPNVLLTNIEDYEAKKILGMIGRHLIFDLSDHQKDYDIKDVADLDAIWSIIMPNIFTALMSARQGWTLGKISPEWRRIEHYASKDQAKKGFPISLGGFGGGQGEG